MLPQHERNNGSFCESIREDYMSICVDAQGELCQNATSALSFAMKDVMYMCN